MVFIITIYIFIVGMILGSFALVLADRTKNRTSWVRGRSKCDFCKHTLHAKDLIPVVSWLFHKGRCAYCQKKLGYSYPLTELFLGAAFTASFIMWMYGYPAHESIALFVLWLSGMVLAAVLFVYDLRWFLLPMRFVYAFIFIAVVHRLVFININVDPLAQDLSSVIMSLIISSGLFYSLNKISKGKWVGDGDAFLVAGIALFLSGPLETWIAVVVASTVGIIVALPQLLRAKKNLKMKMPFGPLLLVGLYISYHFSDVLMRWYSDTFLYLN